VGQFSGTPPNNLALGIEDGIVANSAPNAVTQAGLRRLDSIQEVIFRPPQSLPFTTPQSKPSSPFTCHRTWSRLWVEEEVWNERWGERLNMVNFSFSCDLIINFITIAN